jgi:dihydropyrimidinase/allantoinase
VTTLAAEACGPVHVVHASSPRTVRLVADARRRGVRATVETCPPYLFFTQDALERLGPFAKCNPPLRTAEEVEGLWSAVRGGDVDIIASDHSPFLAEEKSQAAADIFRAPPGLGGLEALAPLMLTAVAERRLSLGDLVRLVSERPAAIFGLTGKGSLDPGADADFTVVDLGATWTFDSARCFTRSKASMQIYDGLRMRGRVESTWVRGVPVFRSGEVTGRPGHGRLVIPGASAA